MASTAAPRRPQGSGGLNVHSLRCSDEVWTLAARRAAREGITMSYVIAQLLEGFGLGYVDPPVIERTFVPTRQPTAAA